MEVRISGMSGKVVLVTGGSSGIGKALCLAFARQGCKVAIHYFTGQDRAEVTVRQIEAAGGVAAPFGADLCSAREIREMIRSVKERFSRLDILVNNAGDPVRRAPFPEVDEALLDRTIAINFRGPFLLTQAALPLLEESRGSIVNVSTSLTRSGSSGDNSHYTSAKGALNTMTVALATELSPRGIRINCVCPGIVDTELHQRHSSPERLQRSGQRNLLRRVASPAEVAETILFVASEAAGFMNGQIIYVDGG